MVNINQYKQNISMTFQSYLQYSILNEDNRVDVLRDLYVGKQIKFNDIDDNTAKQNKITNEDFNKIIEADPSNNKQYTQWILNLYKSGNLMLEDLYKFKEELSKFYKLVISKRIPIENRDINKYKSLSDLSKFIYKYNDSIAVSKTEAKDKALVKEFENYNLYIPNDYKESCRLGTGTRWCTATTSSSGHYETYTKTGKLLIFINKDDNTEKYQLHAATKSFMDKHDASVSLTKFLLENKDIKKWLIEYYKNNGTSEDVEYLSKIVLKNANLTSIKGLFDNYENGSIDISGNNLQNLEGLPEIIHGSLIIDNNKFTSRKSLLSLKGISKIINGDLYISSAGITKIDFFPKEVIGDIIIIHCLNLVNIDGLPSQIKKSLILNNNGLKTLKGSPENIPGAFAVSHNPLFTLNSTTKKVGANFSANSCLLQNLDGGPEIVIGDYIVSDNFLKDIKGIAKHIGGNLNLDGNSDLNKDDYKKYVKHLGGMNYSEMFTFL